MEKTHVIRNRFSGKVIFPFKCESFNLCVHIAFEFKINLSEADLSWAKLSGADLSGAKLPGADLSRSDLSEADLSGADLDFSVGFTLSCNGLNVKLDRKQIIQYLFHIGSNMQHFLSKNSDNDLQAVFDIAKKLQDEFHRIDEVERL